jgi:hypothetical protein
MATMSEFPNTNKACVAIAMVIVIEPLVLAREAFSNQFDCASCVGGKDNIEVRWIGIEHIQNRKPRLLYHYGGQTWIGRIRVGIDKKSMLHLIAEGFE